MDDKTRKAIQQGKLVDFVSLLPENSASSLNTSLYGDLVPIHFPCQKIAKKMQIDSFDRLLSAFSVYATIVLGAYPHRPVHMFPYLNVIQSAHKKTLGLAWLAYDLDFRRRAARDPTLSWKAILPQLYLEKFTGMSHSACYTWWGWGGGGRADHMAQTCPPSSHRDIPIWGPVPQ